VRLKAIRLACNWLQAQRLEVFEMLKTCTLIRNNSICHDSSMQLLHRRLACLLCQEVGKCHYIWVQRECVHCGYTALPQRPHLPTHQASQEKKTGRSNFHHDDKQDTLEPAASLSCTTHHLVRL